VLLHYLTKRGNMKIAFSLKCLYQCIARIQPVAAWLIQSFWLTTHTHAVLWLPKSCNQCVQLGAVGGVVQEKGSRERCRSWTVLHAQCTSTLSCGFPLSQGNAKALDGWCAKTKHRLISCFLINSSAKNYRNRIVYIKIIGRFETQYISHTRDLGPMTKWHHHTSSNFYRQPHSTL